MLAAVAVAFFALPFIGLLWRVPWGSAWSVLTDHNVGQALRLSIECSLAATALSALFGVPLGVGAGPRRLSGALAPCGRCARCRWCCHRWWAGWRCSPGSGAAGCSASTSTSGSATAFPFTTTGVVLAQTFVAMPFLVITVEAALRQIDRRYEEAARSLGGSRWYTFRRVTLPTIRPALIAGAVLAWARALGEFGATITFAGNFPGRTQTMPLAIYLARESDTSAALVLSLVLIVVSFAVIIGLRERWLTAGRDRPAIVFG